MRPDLLIILNRSNMFAVELTIGFESNIAKNKVRKRNKCKNLTQSQKSNNDQVKYINLSLCACGITGKGSKPFFDLLEELKIPDNELTKRMINICIRRTWYVFCMRKRNGQIQNCYNSRSQSCNFYLLSIVLNLSLVTCIDFMTLCGQDIVCL